MNFVSVSVELEMDMPGNPAAAAWAMAEADMHPTMSTVMAILVRRRADPLFWKLATAASPCSITFGNSSFMYVMSSAPPAATL